MTTIPRCCCCSCCPSKQCPRVHVPCMPQLRRRSRPSPQQLRRLHPYHHRLLQLLLPTRINPSYYQQASILVQLPTSIDPGYCQQASILVQLPTSIDPGYCQQALILVQLPTSIDPGYCQQASILATANKHRSWLLPTSIDPGSTANKHRSWLLPTSIAIIKQRSEAMALAATNHANSQQLLDHPTNNHCH